MIIHKLIDHLIEKPGEYGVQASAGLASAVKFEIRGGHFLDDHVQDYAFLLLDAGLLRLPFTNCYFEANGSAFGDPANVAALWATDNPNKGQVQAGTWMHNSSNGWSQPIWGGWGYAPGQLGVLGQPAANADQNMPHRMSAYMLAAILAFMDLRETRTEDVVVKDRVNRHRAAQGRAPLYSHKVLTITPAAREALRVKGDALIARRAHWRRGHLRHLPDKIVPVSPALVRGEGFVSKDYRV